MYLCCTLCTVHPEGKSLWDTTAFPFIAANANDVQSGAQHSTYRTSSHHRSTPTTSGPKPWQNLRIAGPDALQDFDVRDRTRGNFPAIGMECSSTQSTRKVLQESPRLPLNPWPRLHHSKGCQWTAGSMKWRLTILLLGLDKHLTLLGDLSHTS